jgi:tRNA 2-thiocytidine biosynthesis protein TtcA
MTKKQHDRDKREYDKLVKRLRRNVGQAIADYSMIEHGDHIMVCMSGGKDSYTLLDLLLMLQESAPVDFTITAVNLDQKQPGFPEDVLPTYLSQKGIPFRIVERDTYSIVKRLIPEGKTTCSLCSRLRRGILYKTAKELGATKVALGHHRSDILETFFLNMFYGGTLKAMPPKLVSDDGNHVVIRPLAYCKEEDILAFSQEQEYPIIPCDLCGSQPNLQRQVIKDMLQVWDKKNPGRIETIFRSLSNAIPSHLMDPKLYNFRDLVPTGEEDPLGDVGFDSQFTQGHPVHM